MENWKSCALEIIMLIEKLKTFIYRLANKKWLAQIHHCRSGHVLSTVSNAVKFSNSHLTQVEHFGLLKKIHKQTLSKQD